jgi:hypothetical protein
MVKKIFIGLGSLVLFVILIGIGSCCLSVKSYNNEHNAIPVEIMRGTLQPVKDCFGVVIDYTMNDISLVDNGICYDKCAVSLEETASTCASMEHIFYIDKVDNQNYAEFHLNEYQENSVYIIYKRTGDYLWFHAVGYYIGCE